MKEQSDVKGKARENCSNKSHGFKKKGGGRNKGKIQHSTADDIL